MENMTSKKALKAVSNQRKQSIVEMIFKQESQLLLR